MHFEGQRCDEVGVYLVDTSTICDLHEQFFQDPSPTDTISLPMDDEDAAYRVLGEVFVCPETACKYVTENGGDPYIETTLYIVHSLLHLMGYDDIDDVDRAKMREAEARHMEHLVREDLALKSQDE